MLISQRFSLGVDVLTVVAETIPDACTENYRDVETMDRFAWNLANVEGVQKVITLPMVALGVGIGVDYGIYIYDKLDIYLKEGFALREAYYRTLRLTGRAVIFTGFTLAAGVGTWAFSTLQFQATSHLRRVDIHPA